MKGYLKTLILLLWIGNSFAQSYIPIVKEGNYWKVEYNDIISFPPNITVYTYILRGDSSINSVNYKKLYHCESNTVHALLREDSLNRKVFGIIFTNEFNYDYECILGDEQLLYDYNLNVGDTTNTCIVNGIVNSIDTLMMYGNQVIGYKIGEEPLSLYMYMGIGGQNGLIQRLIKMAQGSLYLGSWGNTSDCSNITNLLPVKNDIVKVLIYPNPVQNVLHIEINTLQSEVDLKVFNHLGEALYEMKNIATQQEFNISMKNLPQGVYFVYICADNKIYAQKIIKE